MSDDLVERIRYEADITDIQSKLRVLADKQDALASDTDRSTGRMHSSWSKLKSLVSTGGKWLAGISAATALLIPQLLDQNTALESMSSKAKVVFSDGSLAQVQSWAKGVAGSLGMTESQTIAMAASMADLFKPMGFTADAAAKLSTGLGDMSGALSAWSGGKRSAVEVSDILTKAMLGERDGLKELGVAISEADVTARLAANGSSNLTGKQLEQAKALATLQLVQEKSTDAMKAWNDGSMDSTKNANKAKASFAQLVETLTRGLFPIIQGLLPVLTELADIAKDLAPVLGVVAKGIGLIGDAVSGLIGGIKWLAADLTDIDLFKPEMHAAISKTAFTIGEVAAATVIAGDGTKELAQKTGELAEAQRDADEKARSLQLGISLADLAVRTMQSNLKQDKSWADMQLQLEDFARSYRRLAPDSLEAQSALAGMKLALTDFLTDLDNMPDSKVLELASNFDPANQQATVDAIKAWKQSQANIEILFSVRNIEEHGQTKPHHNGGIVSGMPGSEVLARLLPGEQVLTRGQQANGNGGLTINGGVHVHTDDNPRRFYDEGLWRVA